MPHSRRVPLPALILALAALACALPAISVQDPATISTAAAQTVIAALTQASTPVGASPSPSPEILSPTATNPLPTLTPSLTSTPETPTLTVTATPTATASLTLTPTLTFTPTLTLTLPYTTTPQVPLVSVSVPTNCRTGPGIVYDRVGALLEGEVAQVVARNGQGNYWYIRNPDRPGGFCWLWGEYATVTGNIGALPVYTAMPSPTPTFTPTPIAAFQLSYAGLENCVGWWADFRLRNTGSIPFQSVAVTIRDATTGVELSMSTDDFTDRSGCKSFTVGVLRPEDTIIVSSPELRYDPSGHRMDATITLCSKGGLNGACAARYVRFQP